MPKITKKPRKSNAKASSTQSTAQGIIAGIASLWRNTRDSAFGHTFASASRFTRSGIVTLGSLTWYAVVTMMVVVFPIRRAVEMEVLMEEERQREAMRFNPDTALPNVTGLYSSGSGSSTVPIVPQYNS